VSYRIFDVHDRDRSARIALLLGILLTGIALRISGVSTVPLWLDEEYTLQIARRDFGSIPWSGSLSHPPGYPLLAHLCFVLATSEWVIRVPAILGGVLGIFVVYALLRDLGYERCPFAGAFVVSASVYCVYYSQEARGYTLMSSLSGLVLLLVVRYVRFPTAWTLSLLLLAVLSACMFHFLAALTCLPLLVTALAFDFRRRFYTKDPRCTWAALAPWPIFFAAAGLAAALLYGRLAMLVAHLPYDAETGLAVGPRFVGQHVARWLGLGSGWSPWVLVPLALGSIELVRKAGWTAMLHLAATFAPFVAAALAPWDRFYQDRYLMAALIPAVVVATAGVAGALRLLSHPRWTSRSGFQNPMLFARVGLAIALVIAVLGPSLEYTRAPSKIVPNVTRSPFHLRYLALISYFDPWLIRGISEGGMRLVMANIESVQIPLPRWPASKAKGVLSPCEELMRPRIAILLVNPFADDAIEIRIGDVARPRHAVFRGAATRCAAPFLARVEASRFESSGERAFFVEYRQTVSGGATGYLRASWLCSLTGLQVGVTVRSGRPELARRYLEEVLLRARCEDGRLR
jgi:hypothetical protein